MSEERGQAALRYAMNGWKVIPLHSPQGSGCTCGAAECGKPGKHPRIGEWQHASCDVATVAAWWAQWPASNIGFRLDGLAVLDVDVKADENGLESLAALEAQHGALDTRARQRSGGGGWHYIFEAVDATKRLKFRPGLDLLTGNGCYIVAEPSVHATGGVYTWTDAPSPLSVARDSIALTVPPRWLLDAAEGKGNGTGNAVPVARILDTAVAKIRTGAGRNDAGLWFFCQLRDNRYSRDEAVMALRDWVRAANECAPGKDRYTSEEARATLRSAFSKPGREPWDETGKDSQAEVLLKMADDFECFRSGPALEPHIRVRIADHWEVWADGKGLKTREVLTHRFYLGKGRAPSREALNSAVDTILAKCGAGPKLDVFVRFARTRDAVYLDMADDEWRCIVIKADGWQVLDSAPVMFKRGTGARPLPMPARGGSLDLLRPLVNAGDDTQWFLMLAWLVGAFQPVGAFSHLVVEGQQGSAKTTTARILQMVLDPSDVGLSAPPKNEEDATLSAMNCGILGYDNLSGCRAELADVFCRFSTGQGFRTRTLYSNLGITVASVKIPVLLNGIDAMVMRGDLLERSITLKLPRIESRDRRTEQEIWDQFGAIHPAVLGALLDVVSTGLRNLPHTKLDDMPRMSDFCLWVTACEPAMPWPQGAFVNAYTGKLEAANRDLAESDPVASALVDWAEQTIKPDMGIVMVAKELLISLNTFTVDTPKDTRHWPLSPEALGHKLVRLAPILRAQGLEVRKLKRTRTERSRWEIWRLGPQGVLPACCADDLEDAA
jgi:hypothetical protein